MPVALALERSCCGERTDKKIAAARGSQPCSHWCCPTVILLNSHITQDIERALLLFLAERLIGEFVSFYRLEFPPSILAHSTADMEYRMEKDSEYPERSQSLNSWIARETSRPPVSVYNKSSLALYNTSSRSPSVSSSNRSFFVILLII